MVTLEMKCPLKEIVLHVECISFMRQRGWRNIAHEWNVIPNKEEHGKGDLVFAKDHLYCVIECKRRSASPKVEEQARFYGAAWKLRYALDDRPVLYGIWTCQRKRILGVILTDEQAKSMCKRPACKLL